MRSFVNSFRFYTKLFQSFQGFSQCFFIFCEVKTDEMIYVLPKEARTWNGSYSNLPGKPFAKFKIAFGAKLRNIDQYIIGCLRNRMLQLQFIESL